MDGLINCLNVIFAPAFKKKENKSIIMDFRGQNVVNIIDFHFYVCCIASLRLCVGIIDFYVVLKIQIGLKIYRSATFVKFKIIYNSLPTNWKRFFQ